MTNNRPDILVQRFIDGDLSEPEVKQALHRIADDKEARSLLQFELQMTQDLASSQSAQPPQDFAARTMEAVAQEPTADRELFSLSDWLRTYWNSLTKPMTLQVRPVSAVAAIFLACAVLITVMTVSSLPGSKDPTDVQLASKASSRTTTIQQVTSQADKRGEMVWIRFLYTNDDADSVAVAGDFSQWEPVSLSPREAEGKTVWTGLVPVSRGEHEYQFLINGNRWVTDPLAPVQRRDGFGAKNAVLNI